MKERPLKSERQFGIGEIQSKRNRLSETDNFELGQRQNKERPLKRERTIWHR